MGYPYGSESSADAIPANSIVGENDIEGACPPRQLEYRIYPEFDFTDLFGNPPENVIVD